jgi:hypothetical protein
MTTKYLSCLKDWGNAEREMSRRALPEPTAHWITGFSFAYCAASKSRLRLHLYS